ncbi:hypothetical protein JMJ99_06685 [Companilactobacillus zhachilii]|uniref:Gp15 family bacteriophage protein n=1 Tax=Companilactobacillus zhachilii TaxID=2304606 RepID=UPI00192475A5|nr:Gp15 family bacteriophage protein [Companilactobacillus zhachilii]MBL3531052.1 hypothetical protein [Companilactobacillus zhachilii]
MNLLTPSKINYKNRTYHVSTSFLLVIEYFKYINDSDHLSVEERLNLALFSFVKESTKDLKLQEKAELVDKIYNSFIFTKKDQKRADLMKHQKKSFDYDQDMDLIYSAFLQQYNIDLSDPDIFQKLSWKKFNALLDGLTDETFFRKVTSYRQVKITDDMNDDTKQFLNQMKLLYALDSTSKDGKLSKEELAAILAPLDMKHKMLKKRELRNAGKI